MAATTKLTITAEKDSSKKFEALVNPNSIDYKSSIKYSELGGKTAGTYKLGFKFDSFGEETVDFSLMLDGTGMLENKKSVADMINDLKIVCYYYVGKNHEPNVVTLNWGTTLKTLRCRLTSMSINYKLFKSDGSPLRAEVSLSFVRHDPKASDVKDKTASSPDLSHLVKVKAGDSLPMLCENIYNDSSLYLEIAKINNLVNFRQLTPGTELLFPPIER
jgi:hypothetical protein